MELHHFSASVSGLPLVGEMNENGQIEGVLRVRKWGKSTVMCIPAELRDFFAVVHRDLIAYRQVGRVIVLRRIRHGELVPLPGDKEQRERSGVGA